MGKIDRGGLEGKVQAPGPVTPDGPNTSQPPPPPVEAPVPRALTEPIVVAREYIMNAAKICETRVLAPATKAQARKLLRIALEHLQD